MLGARRRTELAPALDPLQLGTRQLDAAWAEYRSGVLDERKKAKKRARQAAEHGELIHPIILEFPEPPTTRPDWFGSASGPGPEADAQTAELVKANAAKRAAIAKTTNGTVGLGGRLGDSAGGAGQRFSARDHWSALTGRPASEFPEDDDE